MIQGGYTKAVDDCDRGFNGDGLLGTIVSNREGVFVFKQLAAGK